MIFPENSSNGYLCKKLHLKRKMRGIICNVEWAILLIYRPERKFILGHRRAPRDGTSGDTCPQVNRHTEGWERVKGATLGSTQPGLK